MSAPAAGPAEVITAAAQAVDPMPCTTARQSQLRLGTYPSAVPCARLHTRQVLWEWDLPALADDAELIVAELVTNAIRAGTDGAAGFVTLDLAAGDSCLSIGVWDDSPLMPAPQPHEIDSDDGRGFEIVAMLSTSISVIPDQGGSGKTVWAHVRYG